MVVTTAADPIVFIVDDDEAVRHALSELADSARLPAQSFESATAFLAGYDPGQPGCLLLDVCMPGMSGLELQAALREQSLELPVIVITGHGDVPMARQSFRLGAFDFIEKPFDHMALLDSIRLALAQDAADRAQRARAAVVRERLDRLSDRERQVLELMLSGRLNKQIGSALGIALRTVEDHRRHIMQKMEAGSLVELAQQVLRVQPSRITESDFAT